MSRDGTLQLDASPLSLSVSRDGRSLAAVDGNDIAVWNLENGNPVPTIHAGWEVGCMGLGPDGSRIVAGIGRVLRIWDMRTGLELRTVSGHTGRINAVVFSSDGNRLITGSDDQTIRIYDARPITADLQTESEACTLCEALASSVSSEAELESRIDAYPGVPGRGTTLSQRDGTASLACGSRLSGRVDCGQHLAENAAKGRPSRAAAERSISHHRRADGRDQSCK